MLTGRTVYVSSVAVCDKITVFTVAQTPPPNMDT